MFNPLPVHNVFLKRGGDDSVVGLSYYFEFRTSYLFLKWDIWKSKKDIGADCDINLDLALSMNLPREYDNFFLNTVPTAKVSHLSIPLE